MKDIDKFLENIYQFHRKIRVRLSNELSRGKITIPQYHIMYFLSDRRRATMSELAEHLLVSRAAVTGLVDKLVKTGFVKRKFSCEDRRIIMISLTEKGKIVISKIKKQFNSLLVSAFNKLSSEEKKQFMEMSEKMGQFI